MAAIKSHLMIPAKTCSEPRCWCKSEYFAQTLKPFRLGVYYVTPTYFPFSICVFANPASKVPGQDWHILVHDYDDFFQHNLQHAHDHVYHFYFTESSLIQCYDIHPDLNGLIYGFAHRDDMSMLRPVKRCFIININKDALWKTLHDVMHVAPCWSEWNSVQQEQQKKVHHHHVAKQQMHLQMKPKLVSVTNTEFRFKTVPMTPHLSSTSSLSSSMPSSIVPRLVLGPPVLTTSTASVLSTLSLSSPIPSTASASVSAVSTTPFTSSSSTPVSLVDSSLQSTPKTSASSSSSADHLQLSNGLTLPFLPSLMNLSTQTQTQTDNDGDTMMQPLVSSTTASSSLSGALHHTAPVSVEQEIGHDMDHAFTQAQTRQEDKPTTNDSTSFETHMTRVKQKIGKLRKRGEEEEEAEKKKSDKASAEAKVKAKEDESKMLAAAFDVSSDEQKSESETTPKRARGRPRKTIAAKPPTKPDGTKPPKKPVISNGKGHKKRKQRDSDEDESETEVEFFKPKKTALSAPSTGVMEPTPPKRFPVRIPKPNPVTKEPRPQRECTKHKPKFVDTDENDVEEVEEKNNDQENEVIVVASASKKKNSKNTKQDENDDANDEKATNTRSKKRQKTTEPTATTSTVISVDSQQGDSKTAKTVDTQPTLAQHCLVHPEEKLIPTGQGSHMCRVCSQQATSISLCYINPGHEIRVDGGEPTHDDDDDIVDVD